MAPKLQDDEDSPPDVTESVQQTFKSSFHLIKKYSMKRGELMPCIHDWFEAKRRDDDVGNYWRVHDKIYNLENFIRKHPGGPDWIAATRGTDITEAFESAHVANVAYVEKTLAQYFVADATHPRNSPYTFKEDGFYKTLKKRVEPVLKKVGTGPTTECLMLQDGMFLTFGFFSLLGIYYDIFIFQLIGSLVLGMCVVGGHNFLHQRDTWRRFYFDLIPFSSYEWRLTHGLSHHLFPNSILDFEVQLGEPIIEYLPARERNWVKGYLGIIYSHFLYGIYAPSEVLKRVRAVYRGTQIIRPENLIIGIEIAIAFSIAPSAWAAFKAIALHAFVSSYVLTFNNANAHHHPTTFHDGDEARTDPDFGLCQVDASKSKTDWYHQSTLAIMTTFGDHPMHHLFPTVDVSKQKYIKSIVLETLKEFGELYPEMDQWELFKGSHKQLSRTTPHKIDVYKSRKF